MKKRHYPYHRNCNECGIFYDGDGKFFCSKKCRSKNQEVRNKLKIASTGHKITEETRNKLKLRIPPRYWLGKKLSSEHKKKVGRKAELSSNWKGGITPLRKQIRACFEYRQWLSDCMTRDDFTCICGKRGSNLEVHHIKAFSVIIEENLIDSLEKAISCCEL